MAKQAAFVVCLAVSGLHGVMASFPAQGRCDGSGYMNIGWSGMSESGCRSRASEIKSSGAECDYVSFSSSSGPTHSGNFCQCNGACEALATPDDEDWQTFEVSVSANKGRGPQVLLMVGMAVAAAALFCCGVLASCYFRRRRSDLPPLTGNQSPSVNFGSEPQESESSEAVVTGVVVHVQDSATAGEP
eukprot:TRINITY_DN6415_c0_g1_i1.p1 TRINITY_DN6415_c0_g1~~TRINITY_DN6415_c0_g1_i1.p1  ORF type:complete len:216 (+),score=26.91 TRINITY_DN6415_c0_g1_i1:86-649(+)